jgi:hypothetical protein
MDSTHVRLTDTRDVDLLDPNSGNAHRYRAYNSDPVWM